MKGSGYWHRDADDISNVKPWILCSDVKCENGPTASLPRKLDKIVTDLDYKQGEKIWDDKVFEPYTSEIVVLTGKSGDTFASDTSRCFDRIANYSGPRQAVFDVPLYQPIRHLLLVRIQFGDETIAPSDESLKPDAEDLMFPFYAVKLPKAVNFMMVFAIPLVQRIG